jgi:uncharacterized ferredoxin-like protein
MESEQNVIQRILETVAGQMLTAARTAPKARGVDNLRMAILHPEDIRKVSGKMVEIGYRPGAPAYFHRDAENILKAGLMVIMGTIIRAQEVQLCGRCGFASCDEKNKHPEVPCTFNTGDLGIAIGSAVSVAMDHRVDNRIMYTVGQAVVEMKLLGDDVPIAFGIPLSIASKNPFFDRK